MKFSSRWPWPAGVIASPGISNSNGWTASRHFSNARPAVIRRNIGSGFRVDMCVIRDGDGYYSLAWRRGLPTHTHPDS